MVSRKKSPGANSATHLAYVHDKDYYFEDGSTIVLAEGSLFKIHRTLFERNSAFFRSLMSLPQSGGQESSEGQSDEKPVICPDLAEDFRALCWVVYSSPADVLAQQTWNTIDVPKLIRVVAISHKYDFIAYNEWAWNALDGYYAAQPLNFFDRCGTWPDISRILRLAVECGKKPLADRLEKTWLDQISTFTTRTTAFKEALDAVEGSDLFRRFHAKCYYVYLQSSGVFTGQTQDSIPINLDQVGSNIDESLADLNNERRMRLLTGFWSLSRLRARLSRPPKLLDNPSCARHTRECIPGWDSWWKNEIKYGMEFNDPGKLIEQITEKARRNIGLSWQGPIPCEKVVRSTIEVAKRDFDNSLANHFMLS